MWGFNLRCEAASFFRSGLMQICVCFYVCIVLHDIKLQRNHFCWFFANFFILLKIAYMSIFDLHFFSHACPALLNKLFGHANWKLSFVAAHKHTQPLAFHGSTNILFVQFFACICICPLNECRMSAAVATRKRAAKSAAESN